MQTAADVTEPNPWNDLIELASTGCGALLRARAARCAVELAALRPLHTRAEPYARLVLHQGDQGEVMLAAWQRGGLAAPHDHGLARGYVVMLEGRFLETTYRFDGTELRASAEREHGTGDLLDVPPGLIHDLCAGEDGLSLHVYVPRIHGMRVYDTASRSTLRVADDCGAWIPGTPETILERRPWVGRDAWTASP
jgi:predicted metal-dependent enzyme (double-stranded beta helix superfamily)